MHEASIAQDVLQIIQEALSDNIQLTDRKVKAIHFSQSFPPTVMADSFEFYFTELIRGTIIEGAALIFNESEERGFFITSIEVDEGDSGGN